MFFYKTREKEVSKKYVYKVCILTFQLIISSSLHLFCLIHLVLFAYSNTTLLPLTSFVLLLENILHFYIL